MHAEEASAWFPNIGKPDVSGRPTPSLELYLLGCFRILGRAYCLDGIKELSNISRESMVGPLPLHSHFTTLTPTHAHVLRQRRFFHSWTKEFVRRKYDEWVHFPSTPEEIDELLRQGAALGLPGYLGSMDVSHIRWDRCPASLRRLHVGKEGFPTLAYQVIISHLGRVLACKAGDYGSLNDKAIVRFDGNVQKLRSDPVYTGHEFDVFAEDGTRTRCKGVWLLVDGGYHQWRVLICGFTLSSILNRRRWSRWLASVRKDVEDWFGVWKGRFRIFKCPIEYQSKTDIDNMVFASIILSNMLHEYKDQDSWNQSLNWLGKAGEHGHDGELPAPTVGTRRTALAPEHDDSRRGVSYFGPGTIVDPESAHEPEVETEHESSFASFRLRLVAHWSYAWSQRMVNWIRGPKAPDVDEPSAY